METRTTNWILNRNCGIVHWCCAISRLVCSFQILRLRKFLDYMEHIHTCLFEGIYTVQACTLVLSMNNISIITMLLIWNIRSQTKHLLSPHVQNTWSELYIPSIFGNYIHLYTSACKLNDANNLISQQPHDIPQASILGHQQHKLQIHCPNTDAVTLL